MKEAQLLASPQGPQGLEHLQTAVSPLLMTEAVQLVPLMFCALPFG